MANIFVRYFGLFKETLKEFSNDNVVKLSASLAYNTIFAIGPFLLVIISLTGLFFEQKAVTGRMFYQIQTLIGKQGAEQILSIIQNMQQQNAAARFGIIGIVVLVIGATSMFADIQDSINYIWSIKAKPKKGWLKYLKNRLLSFSLIVGLGFLFIVTLLINTISDALTDRLQHLFADEAVIFFKVFNVALLFVIISLLFAVIYKVLPDARIRWKDAMKGAWFTGVLFLIGKFLIGFYLGNSRIGNTYGAAASVIIILSWVYYTSIILYFGAEFTKVYALKMGAGIEPYDTAVFILKREAKEMPEVKKVTG
ncbi:MAG: YihY/virulence factor BrkB family protein [Bacteroidetes bacterium]|nr:YihY/virulence factor BrkB family protein [Bacteroidota bacterium]